MTLESATRAITAGQAASGAAGTAVCIAIVDPAGHLMAFARMDGARLASIDIAVRKARTSALCAMPTSALGPLSQPGGPIYGIEATNDVLVSMGGGLPLTDASGQIIGAVGVSGATTPGQDALLAEACSTAL